MVRFVRNLLRGYKGMQRSRRILYMSRQRPFGSLLKRLLSHSRNKDSADIYARHRHLFSTFAGSEHWSLKKREMEILPLRVSALCLLRGR